MKYTEEKLISLRKEIHSHPELGFTETETTKIVKRELSALGLDLIDIGLETGAAALLRGSKPGPTVVIRSDIDALPVTEKTNVDYTSLNPGKMHACCHDIHMTATLGCASLLTEKQNELTGNILFLFQPAEESVSGARKILDGPLFNNVKPDAFLGMHAWPDFPFGKVGIWEGPVMAAKCGFKITVNGKGGHGSTPSKTKDPILAGTAIVNALQTITSHSVPSQESAVLSVCSIHAGTSDNVIPDSCEILGSFRSFSAESQKTMLTRVNEIAVYTAKSYGCTAEIHEENGCPPVLNNAKLTNIVKETVSDRFGPEGCYDGVPVMISEDFACYAEKAPICYSLFGVATDDGLIARLHNGKLCPSHKVLLPAASFLTDSALAVLKTL